jgi:hypothetical protein
MMVALFRLVSAMEKEGNLNSSAHSIVQLCPINCLGMIEEMFHIMGRQVVGLDSGGCYHNGCIFEVDNLCGL